MRTSQLYKVKTFLIKYVSKVVWNFFSKWLQNVIEKLDEPKPFLNFAKSQVLSCSSKVDNSKKIKCAIFEL